ncbi:hypothetical protein Athai_23370 [Actinocatenispora thailandica]|uniref:Uncharacterized protein n=1 Tax=Actinocatenispora thailandica TaxID=227318 RepID=A0A7R7HX90_9ACTN|nr:hypothetical protein [Actinocatenispora thailandica]BCJ34834.1 hypothetical protein Athai_23370 [Actinocatenispora thailandica]
MGRIVKTRGEGVTKYYWYPGEKADWIRAAVAVGAGLVVLALVALFTHSGLWASVLGTSVTAAVAGLNFGRRDARALRDLPDIASARKAAIVDTGRAMWRAMVKGCGAAGAAVLVANMSSRGFVADWLLPLVPAVVGALAHQAGMIAERMSEDAAARKQAVEATPLRARAAEPTSNAA